MRDCKSGTGWEGVGVERNRRNQGRFIFRRINRYQTYSLLWNILNIMRIMCASEIIQKINHSREKKKNSITPGTATVNLLVFKKQVGTMTLGG